MTSDRVPACRRRSTCARRTTSRSACRPRSASTTSCRPRTAAGWRGHARRSPRRVQQAMTEETCILAATLIVDRPDDHGRRRRRGPAREDPGKEFAHVVLGDSVHDPLRRRRSSRRSTATRRPDARSSRRGPRASRSGSRRLIDDSDELVGGVHRAHARLAPAVPGDRAAGAHDHRPRRRPAGGRHRDALPRRADRADDERHPLAVRARRPACRARPVIPRPAVQLHVLRRRLADVRLPGCRRGDRAARPALPAADRPPAPPGPGRRHPAPHPARSSRTATGTSPRSRSASSSPSPRSSTTSRSSGPPAS